MSKELKKYKKIEDGKVTTSQVIQSSFGIVFDELKKEDYIIVENARQKETLVVQKLEKYLDKDSDKPKFEKYFVNNVIKSKRDNILLARQYIKENVYYLMKFESPNITLPTVEYYVDNPTILEERNFDRDITINLIKAWRVMLNINNFNILEDVLKLHAVVAKDQALDYGFLRDGKVTISNTDYVPPIPTEASVTALFNEFELSNNVYEAAARFLVKFIKMQPFYDGNKRMAFLVTNRLLIEKHKGLVVVNDKHFKEFSQLLKEYYDDENNIDKIIKFMMDNCFYNTKDKQLMS